MQKDTNDYSKAPSGLSDTAKTRLTLVAVAILFIVSSLIAWPYIPSSLPGAGFFNQYYPHLGLDLQGGAHLVYEADTSAVAADEVGDALDGARNVIERRVNALGVAEPVVQTSNYGTSNRIIVELAGVHDVNAAIRMIGETPLLEFKELLETPTSTSTSSDEFIDAVAEENMRKEQKARDIILELQQGASFDDLSRQQSDDIAVKDKGGDLGWVGRGVFTPLFERALFDEMKVEELRAEPLRTEFGYHVIKKLEERTDAQGNREVHAAHILVKTASLDQTDNQQWVNTALSGRQLRRAQVIFDPQSNRPQISLTFSAEGAELFKEITERNVGSPLAIFLDRSLLSAPVVQTVISGGQAVITGDYTLDEAKTLAQRLNAGALPLPVKLISQQTIGATLGHDSLVKSLYAGTVGFALVALFMISCYYLPGFLAVIALLLYTALTISMVEIIPITLTLSGITGFILSLGMAVDANVLIFERMREELRRGLPFSLAIDEGFRRAWPAIRDSNVSSIITCIILYWYGSSLIRGFALTLGLGVFISMFSAISVTRTMLRFIVQYRFGRIYALYGKGLKQRDV